MDLESYSSLTLLLAITEKNLEDTTLSEITQAQRDDAYSLSLMHEIINAFKLIEIVEVWSWKARVWENGETDQKIQTFKSKIGFGDIICSVVNTVNNHGFNT